MDSVPSSEPLDLDTIRSELRELEEIRNNCNDDMVSEMCPSDSDQLLKDCALQLESKVEQIMCDCSDFSFLGIEDLDAFVEHLKEELNMAEAESAKISSEIEVLTRNHVEDFTKLESDNELLNCSLDFMSSQDVEKGKGHACREEQLNSTNSLGECEFEVLKLDNQVEENKVMLKSLQDLDSIFKRIDAVEQIEDALSGLKVIEFDGVYIRLSLRTYLPKLEDLLCPQKIEDAAEPSEVNHELLIEVVNGSMELKNAEIFPSDVYINDIIDAANAFRSSLEWFVRKVQDRIILCTMRRVVVKHANKSRHSFEYVDRDETIVAHLVGGIDAFIKLSQGWPIAKSPLKVLSLKSSDHHSKEISLSFLCKVEEVVNYLDIDVQLNLLTFVEAIEKILVEQMRIELHSDSTSKI
ncbi:uncharacterized protein LOC110601451 isoform X2 [Manihot esculenta]|uniref:Uncharacterized protein n=1 Tax=Manihot esculenta TaxID=3983 RepID=A0ACB7G9G0_MANES|nr:uncharacterized protein LOC110601451 isoform X2 [Manihot esculenta]KAG8636902.1 hypothetical protein MANES_15G055900v8 [Manihot esculenta]